MITTNAIAPSTQTETQTQAAQDAIATLEPAALDEVSGGWMYSPYANPYASPYANPYFAGACGPNPYAAARYEAHLARRAAWMGARMGWWY